MLAKRPFPNPDDTIESLTRTMFDAVQKYNRMYPTTPPEVVAAAVSFLAACVSILDIQNPEDQRRFYDELMVTLKRAVSIYTNQPPKPMKES